MIQSSGNGDAELEVLSPSGDSWTEAQIPDLCTSWTSVTQPKLCTTTRLAEQVQLPDFIDPIEDFTEEDLISERMAVAGRSPKHPRTESDDNGMEIAILMEKAAEKAVEKAADRFSSSMDAKISSMMEHLDKRIEDKVDSKLVPVMDRLSALEKTNTSSTRSGPSSSSDGSSGSVSGPSIFAPSYLEIKGWCAFKDRETLGLTEGQAK